MKNRVRSQLKWWLFTALVAGWFGACKPTAPKVEVEYPTIVELIGDSLELPLLRQLLESQGVDSSVVYAWKNHLLVYDFPGDTAALKSQLPGGTLNIYTTPYYVFDRSTCAEGQVEGPWEHKILSANLVADPVKQQEYLNYHKTQYEEWPEISQGFCRAEFQQLLMYRQGRQMILVISIPAGKDYDTLNVRTVENNPRVDDWNAIMGQYQEGIEGTEPGETWVFFEPVTK
jgi:L-rhamnose mutarotase